MPKRMSTLHNLKNRAHKAFDPIWMHGLMSRDDAYSWMQEQLGLSVEYAHFSILLPKELEWVIANAPKHYKKMTVKKNKKTIGFTGCQRKHSRKKLKKKRNGYSSC